MARITDLRRTIRERAGPVAARGIRDGAEYRPGFGRTPDAPLNLTR